MSLWNMRNESLNHWFILMGTWDYFALSRHSETVNTLMAGDISWIFKAVSVLVLGAGHPWNIS